MTAITIASLIALALGGASFLVFRKLTRARVSVDDLKSWSDFEWRGAGPLERLLNPAEFAALRQRGLSRQRIRQLRSQRRKIFRMYLRRLTREFNTAHAALEVVLLSAAVDRPDLAHEMGQQRLLFYRGLIGVELRLMLHALGFDSVPSLALLQPVERMHLEFCRLAPAAV